MNETNILVRIETQIKLSDWINLLSDNQFEYFNVLNMYRRMDSDFFRSHKSFSLSVSQLTIYLTYFIDVHARAHTLTNTLYINRAQR